jgi:hypothetical protein
MSGCDPLRKLVLHCSGAASHTAAVTPRMKDGDSRWPRPAATCYKVGECAFGAAIIVQSALLRSGREEDMSQAAREEDMSQAARSVGRPDPRG